jgi:antitoxin (DNA-binding transcriptional repressor) of toxin-antitoxin stability system
MSRRARETAIARPDKASAVVEPGARIERGAWSVLDAKARLSEILRLARAGKPQTIGSQDPCVVVSGAQFDGLRRSRHLGKFLLASAPTLDDVEWPSRADKRGDPFADH